MGPIAVPAARLGVLLASLLWLHASAAIAQMNTGEIAGVVRDAAGGLIVDAAVTGFHPDSGAVVERLTDAAGRFVLPALRLGVWEVTVRMASFAVQTRRGVVVEMGRAAQLEFVLDVRGLTEQVVVDAVAPLLQTTTAEISDVIENREVVQLPLNGRNFLALAQLSDAVVCRPAARAARRCSRPARCRTSAASGRATTSTCSTAPRSPTSCSTTWSSTPRSTRSRSSRSRSRCTRPSSAARRRR